MATNLDDTFPPLAAVPLRFATLPVAGLVPINMDEANALLVNWGHYLGPCARPFRSEGWAIDLDGEPIAVAVSSSPVSDHIVDEAGREYDRSELVELSRLCSNPETPWATRIMLRYWREVIARRWPCPSPRSRQEPLAGIAYSQNSRHEGDIYRFDGWKCVRENAGASLGAGTWSTKRTADSPEHGKKRLWIWRYAAVTNEVAA